MTRNRPLAVVAAFVVSASLAVPAAASAKPTITMSGSTSVAPLAALLAKKYLTACGHCVNFKLLQGGSDIGIADVAAGRVTIGNSSRDPKPSDPGGLVFNKIAHDAVCIVTNNVEPVAGHRPGRCPGDLRRQRPQLGQRPGLASERHDRRHRPHPRLRYPGRLPEDLHGLDQGLRRRQPEGVQRPRPAVGQVRPERRSATSRCSSPGPARDPLQGRRLHRCATRSPASTAACATSTWSPAARPRAPAKAWISWITHSSAAASIIATEWVPLQLVAATRLASDRAAEGTAPTSAPSSCSARWRRRSSC